MKRMAARLVLVATILLSASGCSLGTSASNFDQSGEKEAPESEVVHSDASSELVVTRLKASVDQLPGVEKSRADFDATGDFGPEAFVWISAPAASLEQVAVVAETVRKAFDDLDLAVEAPHADIMIGDNTGVGITGSAISRVELAAELDYWWDIRKVLGRSTTMDLRQEPEGYSRRIIGPDRTALTVAALRDRWPEVMAIPDSGSAKKSWWFGQGLTVSGSLPPRSVADLLAELAVVGPQVGGFPSSTITIPAADEDLPQVVVTLDAGAVADDVFDSPAWPLIVAATDAAIDSYVPVDQISYSAFRDISAAFHGTVFMGECAAVFTMDEGDPEFFDELVSAGIRFPAGSKPGYCF